MLGPKPVTCIHFESFGGDWFTDITKQLKLDKVINMKADYGELPDMAAVDWNTDVRDTQFAALPSLYLYSRLRCRCAGDTDLQRHNCGRALSH